MTEYSIGIDLGGTNLRAAAIDSAGKMIRKISGGTHLSTGRDAVVDDMVKSIRLLRDEFGSDGLTGVGVGSPGFILLEKGVITGAPNLPGFDNFPLRDAIEHELGASVTLENDANAAALGEQWMGAGRGVDNLVLFTLGTGVGGGIIAGGKILHGFLGMAGELGHMTVAPNGNPCGCGNQGCLEKHASATSVIAMARMMGLGADLTSEDIYNLAVGGNEKAQSIFRAMGQALGIALATMINALNFPLYLLSGGVLGAWDQFAPAMLEECRRRSFTFRNTNTRIEKATLGNEAGLYGAAYLPHVLPRN
jgi:glucokinase